MWSHVTCVRGGRGAQAAFQGTIDITKLRRFFVAKDVTWNSMAKDIALLKQLSGHHLGEGRGGTAPIHTPHTTHDTPHTTHDTPHMTHDT